MESDEDILYFQCRSVCLAVMRLDFQCRQESSWPEGEAEGYGGEVLKREILGCNKDQKLCQTSPREARGKGGEWGRNQTILQKQNVSEHEKGLIDTVKGGTKFIRDKWAQERALSLAARNLQEIPNPVE